MLVHRLRQWASIEPARYTGVQLALAKEENTRRRSIPVPLLNQKWPNSQTSFDQCLALGPGQHDASKQCCFKADPPSTTLAQPQNNPGSTHRALRATCTILNYSQQIIGLDHRNRPFVLSLNITLYPFLNPYSSWLFNLNFMSLTIGLQPRSTT